MPLRKKGVVALLIEGNEPKDVQTRLISSAIAFSRYVSTNLEVLLPNCRTWPSSKVLSSLSRIPNFKVTITSFGRSSKIADEVKEFVQEKRPRFFVLDRDHLTGTLTKQERLLNKKVLSEILVPTLLLNCQKKEIKVPFLSLFVPMSGELRGSPALEWSIKFANQMRLPVDLLHVTHQLKGVTYDPSLMGKICDQFYHEYPYLVSEFVSQGSPYSSMHEKEVIRRFIHCTGIELNEIIKCGGKQARPLVVIEWKGSLERGHAKVLKGILSHTDWPILLTRQRTNHNIQEEVLRRPHAA